METTKCAECKSVMGLIAKTPRWKLYKCFSCGRLMGRIANDLKEHEVEYATMEMDSYAGSLIRDEHGHLLQGMIPEERDKFLGEITDDRDERLSATGGLKRMLKKWRHFFLNPDCFTWLSSLTAEG